jgi:hypothetical protein
VRVGHAGEEVGGAGPERGEAYAGVPREAPVHIRHERGALLVAGGDERDVRVAQRKQKVFHLFAGHAKDVLHTFAFEAGDEEVGGFHDGTQTVEKSKRQGITPPNRRLGPVFCEFLR